VGNSPLVQHDYTHKGQTRAQVLRNGASFDEQVMNEYLHVGAELGLPGLLFYLLILLAFFAKSLHALERLPAGTRKVLLLGCISAVAAQCVDAFSNPAWRYPVCALYFWLVLGIGIALVRMAYRPTELRVVEEPALEGGEAFAHGKRYSDLVSVTTVSVGTRKEKEG
jgi:hypothetical protein